jgi:hypothetical protein
MLTDTLAAFFPAQRLFLLCTIALLGRLHISRPLPQNGFFGHVDSGGSKGIANPGAMGNTGHVKGIFSVMNPLRPISILLA